MKHTRTNVRKSRDDPARSEIAARLRQVIAVRGLTIIGLSKAAGVPDRTLANYVGGQRWIPADALARICKVLQVSADWLLFGKQLPLDVTVIFEALDAVDGMGRASLRDRSKAFLDFYRTFYDDDYNITDLGAAALDPARSKRRNPPRSR
jgi:transcriptional regulator with XRE-family HTH domain